MSIIIVNLRTIMGLELVGAHAERLGGRRSSLTEGRSLNFTATATAA